MSGDDTPDFILAKFLLCSLDAFDSAVKARSAWYNVPVGVGHEPEEPLTITQMLASDGLYVVGDTTRNEWLAPIAVLNGEAYAWEREPNPLRKSGWHPTALVVAGPIRSGTIAEQDSAKEQGK